MKWPADAYCPGIRIRYVRFFKGRGRHGTWCTQWDYVADRFGTADCYLSRFQTWILPLPPALSRPESAPDARRVWLQPLEER